MKSETIVMHCIFEDYVPMSNRDFYLYFLSLFMGKFVIDYDKVIHSHEESVLTSERK
jgi:hypothetical protein